MYPSNTYDINETGKAWAVKRRKSILRLVTVAAAARTAQDNSIEFRKQIAPIRKKVTATDYVSEAEVRLP